MNAAANITFSAYFIQPQGAVEQALENAAKRGAHVTVRLNGYFYNGRNAMLSGNKQAVRALKAVGADAKIVHRSDRDGPAMHLKAAVCDGVAFLDDRNWTRSGDTVIRDNKRDDVDAIRRAASYVTASCEGMKLDKAGALADESNLIRGAHGASVEVAVESISMESRVYSALLSLARAGCKPHLLVSKYGAAGSYGDAAERLQRSGVVVRVGSNCEKFAIVNGTRAWIGSANGTSSFPDRNQFEWGILTKARSIVRALQSRFSSAWNRAQPLPPE